MEADRVGLGWRPALAAGIVAHLDHIDALELIADDHFAATARELRALRSLGAQRPLTLHGVAMGLASASAVAPRRLERMARLVAALEPESWSEHLAFVRAGGVEIGHLAAPPRTPATVAATIANLARARAVVGTAPQMENIATLIAPPASTLDEAQWISQIADGANIDLLLDLHNLYANAVNFGVDPAALLLQMPLTRVRTVHISGGHWIAEPGDARRRRLLDDHVHDVPPEVFALLALLAHHAPSPLTVILERDGHFPDFAHLLAQLDAARAALRSGRTSARGADGTRAGGMSAIALEAFLARLYTDAALRARFLAAPLAQARAAGLNETDAQALVAIDRAGLEMAAASFAHKRAGRVRRGGWRRWLRGIFLRR